MPVEIMPFLCGVLLCGWRRVDDRTFGIVAVLIGAACAALAGELALPAPLALLALGADTLAVAAGHIGARFVIRIALPRPIAAGKE